MKSKITVCSKVMLVGLAFWNGRASAHGEEALRFRFRKGQQLNYQARHTTSVVRTSESYVEKINSRLDIIKQWTVTKVAADGRATLELKLTKMRFEMTRPNGNVLLFDSTQPDKGSPALAKQMRRNVGTTVAIIEVDARGNVLSARKGNLAQYREAPPFGIVLPETKVGKGSQWQRPFEVNFEQRQPPNKRGLPEKQLRKYPCQQTCTFDKIEDGLAYIGFDTEPSVKPNKPTDLFPILEKLSKGNATFNIAEGRVDGISHTINRVLAEPDGERSRFEYRATYQEQFLGERPGRNGR